MLSVVPRPSQVTPDTPLRLSVAAALAFPDRSMTASGLRREAARGRLVTERIAGKDYTTLANIERMRELCQVQVRAPGCGSEGAAGEQHSGSSEMAATKKARAVLRTILSERSEHSPNISPANTSEVSEPTAVPRPNPNRRHPNDLPRRCSATPF